MRTHEQLVDVSLKARGSEKVFHAHRVILAAASDYFTSSLPLIITVNGVKEEDLQDILSYIYLGEVIVPNDRIHSFMEAAKILKIHFLQDMQMIESFEPDDQISPIDIKQEMISITDDAFNSEGGREESEIDMDWSSNNNVLSSTPQRMGLSSPSNPEEIERIMNNQPQVVLQRLPINIPQLRQRNSCENRGRMSKKGNSRVTQVLPYLCVVCQNRFQCKSRLSEHLKAVHSNERPYSCQQCNQTFKWRTEFNSHIKKRSCQKWGD